MNNVYQEPEFNIVFTSAQDIVTASTGDFSTVNGFSGGGGTTAPWGDSSSTGIEI